MADRGMCECGRPRWTGDDLKRWNSELQQIQTSGIEPAWSRAICWTIPQSDRPCPMKRVAS